LHVPPHSAPIPYTTLFRSGTEANMLGVVTRGPGAKGPVLGTRLTNNTIDLTGRGSEGFVCSACSSRVLVMENNIVRAAGRVGFRSEEHTSELQSPDPLVIR